MTNPTPPLLTEADEREVNEVLFDRSGLAAEGWQQEESDDGPGAISRYEWHDGLQFVAQIGPFTRSLDTLRLAEEQLTPEQWEQYACEIVKGLRHDTPDLPDDYFFGGIVAALQLPVALRARALKEVVKE